jgi:hypothetical protein
MTTGINAVKGFRKFFESNIVCIQNNNAPKAKIKNVSEKNKRNCALNLFMLVDLFNPHSESRQSRKSNFRSVMVRLQITSNALIYKMQVPQGQVNHGARKRPEKGAGKRGPEKGVRLGLPRFLGQWIRVMLVD